MYLETSLKTSLTLMTEQSPLLTTSNMQEKEQHSSSMTCKAFLFLIIPSTLDLLQTILGNIGLLWISSSVYQMARGSTIVFSAILSVKYMNKQLYGYHYLSLFLVISSVLLVGASEILQEKEQLSTPRLLYYPVKSLDFSLFSWLSSFAPFRSSSKNMF